MAGGPAESLCVLGAGNSNDLDLRLLCSAFGRVHLVDLDREALEQGALQQQAMPNSGLCLHGNMDISGVLDRIAGWQSGTNVDEQIELLRSPPAPIIPAPFDVVASTGLLTQLLDSVVLALGPDHPRLFDAISAVRQRHLRLLIEILAPAGTAVLVTEIVSSDTFPQLPKLRESELPQAIAQEIARQNFFTGVNPAVLKSLFETDSVLAPLVERVEVSLPWRWQFTERIYAVCALVIKRR